MLSIVFNSIYIVLEVKFKSKYLQLLRYLVLFKIYS
nr:MAG TPA: hypothetical protein [Caudoviricetes sp.]